MIANAANMTVKAKRRVDIFLPARHLAVLGHRACRGDVHGVAVLVDPGGALSLPPLDPAALEVSVELPV